MVQDLKKNLQRQQSGVTLLLAILILSSVLAISFSLATILLIEVRASGDLMRTEPSFYAAQGVTEQGIFHIKRGTSVTLGPTSVGNVQVEAPLQQYTASPVQTIRIPPGKTFATTPSRYTLYSTPTTSEYARVDVQLLDTGSTNHLMVYLCQYDPVSAINPCTSGSTGGTGWTMGNPNADLVVSADPTTSQWSSLTNPGVFNSNRHQELIMVNTGTSEDLYVSMQTFGPGISVPKGLPYFGEVELRVEARNAGLSRSLSTRVPLDTATPVAAAPVEFLGTDSYDHTTGLGTPGSMWESALYGTAGYNLITPANSYRSYPAWATVTTAAPTRVWNNPDPTGGDERALIPPGGGVGFINSWYSSTSFTVDVDIATGQKHRVAFYMIDWSTSPNRSQQIEVLDAATGTVLDSRNISNFADGAFMSWRVSGHVLFRFTKQSGADAVVSGMFFDP